MNIEGKLTMEYKKANKKSIFDSVNTHNYESEHGTCQSVTSLVFNEILKLEDEIS